MTTTGLLSAFFIVGGSNVTSTLIKTEEARIRQGMPSLAFDVIIKNRLNFIFYCVIGKRN